MVKFTDDETKYLVFVIKENKELGKNYLPSGTIEDIRKRFHFKHTKSSINTKLSKLRKAIERGLDVPVLKSVDNDEDVLPEIPNGIGRLCRLAKEIERLSTEFGKTVKEFREEYDDNMDLLRKMGELRKAAENVSRKIVKGE